MNAIRTTALAPAALLALFSSCPVARASASSSLRWTAPQTAPMGPPAARLPADERSTADPALVVRRVYFNASVGPGFLFAGTDSSTDARTFEGGGVAMQLALGGKLGENFVLGVAYFRDQILAMSLKDETIDGDEPNLDDVGFSFDRAGLYLGLYPDPDAGLNFHAFLGYGDLNTHRPDGEEADDPSGVTLGIGGGYEWFVSDHFRLGAQLRASYASLGVTETGSEVDMEVFVPALMVTATYF